MPAEGKGGGTRRSKREVMMEGRIPNLLLGWKFSANTTATGYRCSFTRRYFLERRAPQIIQVGGDLLNDLIQHLHFTDKIRAKKGEVQSQKKKEFLKITELGFWSSNSHVSFYFSLLDN